MQVNCRRAMARGVLPEVTDEPKRTDDAHHPLGVSVLRRDGSDCAPAAKLRNLRPQRLEFRAAA